MKGRIRSSHVWIFMTCVAVFISVLMLHRFTIDRERQMPGTATKQEVSQRAKEAPMPTETDESIPPASDRTDGESLPTANPPVDAEKVEEALAYLETMEAESAPDNQAPAESEVVDPVAMLTQDEMLQLVREGVSYYDSLVESGHIDFFMRISSNPVSVDGIGQVQSGSWEGSFAFSGNRFTANVTENPTESSSSGTKHFAYDGETFEVLRETPNGKILARGSDVKYRETHDPRFWGWDLSGGKPFIEMIDTITVEKIESVAWETGSVYHIKGTLEGAVDIDLWLNPEKSYRPERFIYATKGGDQIYQVVKDFDFIEVAPDLWFPQYAEEVASLVSPESGVETSLYTVNVSLENLRINEPVSSRNFALEPLPGTTVYDSRTRESFVAE